MSMFELIMILCFGAAWPISIYKSLAAKSIEGKSVLFLYVILIGYIAGITHKILYSYDFIIYLYILNGFMVLTDILLYYRNKRIITRNLD